MGTGSDIHSASLTKTSGIHFGTSYGKASIKQDNPRTAAWRVSTAS